MDVGSAIKAWRKRRGLSQNALGQMAGTSANMVGLYERGRSSPTVQQLQRIAGAMNLDLLELLAGPDATREELTDPLAEPGPPRAVARLCTVPFVAPWDGGDIDAEAADRWPVLCDLLPHDACLVTRVDDDSMQPYLLQGDAVLVDPAVQAVSSGNLVIARLNGRVVARRFLELGTGEVLEAYNSMYPPVQAADVAVLGLIVAVVQRSLPCTTPQT
jgi:transcriptional regulator with XRE-family HTH domain